MKLHILNDLHIESQYFELPGMVFPVSSVMLDRVDEYRTTLQACSVPLMDCIEWCITAECKIVVLNDTTDLYRFLRRRGRRFDRLHPIMRKLWHPAYPLSLRRIDCSDRCLVHRRVDENQHRAILVSLVWVSSLGYCKRFNI